MKVNRYKTEKVPFNRGLILNSIYVQNGHVYHGVTYAHHSAYNTIKFLWDKAKDYLKEKRVDGTPFYNSVTIVSGTSRYVITR